MSLRTRLALALAVLAALSVAAVAAVNYAVTERRLYEAVDTGLKSYAAALAAGVDRVDSLLYCPGGEDGGVGIASLPRAAGVPDIVQCVYPDGEMVPLIGPAGQRLGGPAAGVPETDGMAGPWTETLGGQDHRVMAVQFDGRELRIARSLAETARVLGSVRIQSAAVGALIIALAAAAGLLIARWTTGPVTRLTATAETIAATGNLGTGVPTGRRDEIGRLARAFVAMLGSLTVSREQQQRLVQDAGHELRTPLTSLRANVDTMRRHPRLGPELRDRVLADLDSELRELSALVDELIALAVDQHHGEDEQQVDLAALAERAAERARRRGDRAVTVDAVPAAVPARPGQLLRAVANLLDNAVKFSPAGTPVEVTVRPDRIEVRDHGPGIDPADLPHVFDRFYRAPGARAVPGSGLGLAIVQQIVHGCGGTVHAANHPDGGAQVIIRLPATRATGTAPMPRPPPVTT